MILKARGPGKFCSSRTAKTKVGKIDKIPRKVPSGERYLNFLGPAGRKEKISKLEFLLFRRKFLVVGEVVVAYGCDSVSTPEH